MDNLRKSFLDWHNSASRVMTPMDFWRAAYTAGFQRAREKAAEICDKAAEFHMTHDVKASIVDQNRAEDIRHMVVD
jgi:hypothetical protein